MLKHPRLGEALLHLFPDRSPVTSADPWEVTWSHDEQTGVLTRWPLDMGDVPASKQVDDAVAASDKAQADAVQQAQEQQDWALDMAARWEDLSEAERQEVLRRTFNRLFAAELAGE